ncbi:hypothetical protein ABIB94_001060 [Bradyrhizobium sp. JR7.2]|uniref:hypothetical protein n=1 Tax=unclassified Bradyrhizobium TaxID=2631580 RepID=UPI0033984222
MFLKRSAYTVAAVLLPVAVSILSEPALAYVKRIATLPQSLWGVWAPNADACNDADKLAVVVSAKSYKSSQVSCDFIDLSKTPGPNGPIYSARARCIQQGQTNPATSNLIFRPEGSNRISIGPDFKALKMNQKCAASQLNAH